MLLEDVDRLGSEQLAGATTGTELAHLGMAFHVVSQAAPYILTLHDNLDMVGSVAAYLVIEDRIMGATENNRVDLIVLGQEVVDVAAYEVVGSLAMRLAILDQRNPDGAGLATDDDVGEELLDLERIRLRLDGARRGFMSR